jgi:hypothetical protein
MLEYSAQPRQPLKTDPLAYWSKHEDELNLLSKYARRFLSPPATSVASEELFSTARDVFSYRRMRIKARKAEMIIFLKRNLPLFNYKY